MADRYRGHTYLGVTSNLPQRAYQHRHKLVEGYSNDHDCRLLVWYQHFDDLQQARACELRMKKWQRSWKLRLIEQHNPTWRDLFEDIA